MAKRDFFNYYDELYVEYNKILDKIKEIELYCKDNIVDEGIDKKIESIIKPLKDEWENTNYIIFLLKKDKLEVDKYREKIQKDYNEISETISNFLNDVMNEIDINNQGYKNLLALKKSLESTLSSLNFYLYLLNLPNRRKKKKKIIKKYAYFVDDATIKYKSDCIIKSLDNLMN